MRGKLNEFLAWPYRYPPPKFETGMNSILKRLTTLTLTEHNSKAFASGRWWPQPQCASVVVSRRCMASSSSGDACAVAAEPEPTETSSETELATTSHLVRHEGSDDQVALPRENAYPVFAKPRGPGHAVYQLVPGAKGELLADYVLFEDSMRKAAVPWVQYNYMTTDERDVMMAHLKSIQNRKLTYKDPKTGKEVKTVSQLLYDGKCCGEGCRHCPYEMENADEKTRKFYKWNGAYYI